nr:DUF1661 domain-containing protein [Porphyromonas gingivalis]
MWRENFSVLARERKNSHATTKKFSRRFSGKHAPQSERFWFVFPKPQVVPRPTMVTY